MRLFLGVNRHLTIEMVRQLPAMNAGGAVCFASGFGEVAEDGDTEGAELDQACWTLQATCPYSGPIAGDDQQSGWGPALAGPAWLSAH